MTQSKLRFKREDGTEFPEWVMKQFSDISVPFKKRNKACLNLEIYSINNQVGFIPQEEQFEDAGYLNDTDTSIYMIVPPNHFAYNPARINVGSIGYQNVGHDVQVSSLYEVFATTGECDDSFIWHWFHTPLFNKMVMKYGEGGVRVYYYYDKLCETPIVLPCLEEQQKIANFLSTVDEVITQSEAEVQNLKQQKKAAMQKIFSQEVRFSREDGTEYPKWEEKKFDSFCDIITKQTGFDYTKTIKASLLTIKDKDTLPYLQTKNFSGINFDYQTDYYIPLSIAQNFEKIILDRKCLLFSIVGASVGNIALFPNIQKCFLSGAICVAKPTNEEQTAYLYYYMCSEKGQSQIRNVTKGSGQATITVEDIRLFTISTPCLEEQQKIADFLSDYDEAITCAKQELDKWKELKKGLLQQMFV